MIRLRSLRCLWLMAVVVLGCAASLLHARPLVVYCAHDREFAEPVLASFEKATGIGVTVRYDSEATKSLALTEQILREKDQPRCDVFWNNQWLGTAELKAAGVLEPYQGDGWKRMPEAWRDPEAQFTGFAGRMRVWIFRSDRIQPTPEAIAQRLAQQDLSRLAIARPLYGTTLSHYSVLWSVWGEDKLKAWHHDWRKRGIIEKGGNATVKNLVAQGVCDLGLTDSDDYYAARDAGSPVGVLPIRLDDQRTLCIPNTVAIIRGSSEVPAARRLVDYLLSQDVELQLARSAARQIPLGPVEDSQLPPEVRQLRGWAQQSVPASLGEGSRGPCLQWLKSEYLQ